MLQRFRLARMTSISPFPKTRRRRQHLRASVVLLPACRRKPVLLGTLSRRLNPQRIFMIPTLRFRPTRVSAIPLCNSSTATAIPIRHQERIPPIPSDVSAQLSARCLTT